jgi:4'-phosphopantetheinyl transferase
MEVIVNHKLYNTDINSLIEDAQHTIPVSWRLQKEKFVDSSLFYKKILARLMLIELIENNFSLFHAPDAALQAERLLYSGISLNISYSNDLIVVAASSDGLVGIDVEKIVPVGLDLFEKEFTNKEWEQINNAKNKLEWFYVIWTRKESVLKADGRGLNQGLSFFSVTDETVTLPSSPHNWSLASFRFLEDYLVSLATSDKVFRIQLQESHILS